MNATTLGYLSLVNEIEALKTPEEVYEIAHLKEVIEFAEKTKANCILLSCTHFSYIVDEIRKHTHIAVIDLDSELQKIIESKSKV